jgi:hypothetical protein
MPANSPSDIASLEAQFAQVCARARLRVELLEPHVTRRMVLLAELTSTFEDCARAIDLAEEIFVYCDDHGAPFTATEQTIVRVGSLFSDIGKTGPLRASATQQRVVARVFAVEGVRNEHVPLVEFLHSHFGDDATEATTQLHALGLDIHMTLRAFWNLHSGWTFELLQNAGLPLEAVAAAAAHHLLEDVNPQSIVADDNRFTRNFGENVAFDRSEKLVILLDKYDAVRRRGRRDHRAAIGWLHRLLETHQRFGKDSEFRALIDVLDAAFETRVEHWYVV